MNNRNPKPDAGESSWLFREQDEHNNASGKCHNFSKRPVTICERWPSLSQTYILFETIFLSDFIPENYTQMAQKLNFGKICGKAFWQETNDKK